MSISFLFISGVSKPVGLHDFGDVLNAIRRNETTGEVFKKILSATAALSERADSHPVFMMWTIPTTILALLGSVYFVGMDTWYLRVLSTLATFE